MNWSSANVWTSIKTDVLVICWSVAFTCVTWCHTLPCSGHCSKFAPRSVPQKSTSDPADLSWHVKCWFHDNTVKKDLASNYKTAWAVSLGQKAKCIISAQVMPAVKHGGGCVRIWTCFGTTSCLWTREPCSYTADHELLWVPQYVWQAVLQLHLS